MSEKTVEISSKTLWQIFFVILGLIFLYFIRQIVAIFFAALIIASAVDLMCGTLRKLKIPRLLGVIMIYLCFIFVLALISYFIIPIFAAEFKTLAVQFPELLEKVQRETEFLKRFDILENAGEFLNIGASSLRVGGESITEVSSRIFGGLIAMVSIFVISFYLSLQEKGIENFLRLIVPKKQENYVIDLWLRSQRKLGRWLQGQLFLSLVIGVSVYIGLSLLGVRYALILAIVAAALEIIPNVGPVLAAAPAILIASLDNLFLGILTLILYVFIQQMENYLLVPNVIKKVIGLNPVIVIIALLVGVKMGGILGMVLAVPLAAVFVEFLIDLTKKKPKETVIAKSE
jgi:predicted PurR-regulated permease PerM